MTYLSKVDTSADEKFAKSIALKEDFDHHLCFGKISWYFYQCEDFEKKAWTV